MYKERLIAILDGLECREIETLIEEPPELLKEVGQEMTRRFVALKRRHYNVVNPD